jgi:hypothetical protein
MRYEIRWRPCRICYSVEFERERDLLARVSHHLCWFQFALNSDWTIGGSGWRNVDEKGMRDLSTAPVPEAMADCTKLPIFIAREIFILKKKGRVDASISDLSCVMG